jgi:ankyrin repeat protein
MKMKGKKATRSKMFTTLEESVFEKKVIYLDSDNWIEYKSPKVTVESDLWVLFKQFDTVGRNISSVKVGKVSIYEDSIGNKRKKIYVNNESLVKNVKSITKESAALLISLGVDPDFQDNDGNTALHKAIKFGRIELIKVLVKNGAKKNIRVIKIKTVPQTTIPPIVGVPSLCACILLT